MNINLGSGNDDVIIESTHEGVTNLYTGDGDDEIIVKSLSGHTFIEGGAGDDDVIVGSDYQTIDQVKLYGDRVRWFVDVALPEADPPAGTLRYLRTLADRAVATATGPTAGSVHLNFPFRKPLEPTPVAGDVPDQPTSSARSGRVDGQPFTGFSRGILMPSAQQVDMLTGAIQ